MAFREEIIGDCRLILGDCRDVLPTLPKVDAVVTDPPYGIGADSAMHKAGGTRHGAAMAAKRHYAATDWDSAPPDAALMQQIRAAGRWQIIFGGNYYSLPSTSCWLVWDKLNGENDFADCELAWTNMKKAVRRIQYRWNGMIRQNNEPRGDHPTQKPVGVMRWAIEQLPPDTVSILDPYAGSGTTGVAAVQLGKSFTGIEREAVYFDAMCRRIEEATKQPDFFVEPATKPKQESMFGDGA